MSPARSLILTLAVTQKSTTRSAHKSASLPNCPQRFTIFPPLYQHISERAPIMLNKLTEQYVMGRSGKQSGRRRKCHARGQRGIEAQHRLCSSTAGSGWFEKIAHCRGHVYRRPRTKHRPPRNLAGAQQTAERLLHARRTGAHQIHGGKALQFRYGYRTQEIHRAYRRPDHHAHHHNIGVCIAKLIWVLYGKVFSPRYFLRPWCENPL